MGLNGVNNQTVAFINSTIQLPAYSDIGDSINLYYGKSMCVSGRVYMTARKAVKDIMKEKNSENVKMMDKECNLGRSF